MLRPARLHGRASGLDAQLALVRPVFTAHPSEARRRTILEKMRHDRYAARSVGILPAPAERAREAISTITAEVEAFWFTDIVRTECPTVLDEIRHGLGLVAPPCSRWFRAVYRNLEDAVARTFPGEAPVVPPLLRFG